MEGIIGVVAVILILVYIVFAILCISACETLSGSIGASIGFLCGGFVIIPLAEAISTFICWTISVILGFALIAVLLNHDE